MKSLIIYESCFGNTRAISRAIAETLSLHGEVEIIAATDVQINDLKDIDLLVLGCPTQRHGVAAATRALLDQIPLEGLRGIRVALFDTRLRGARWLTGSAADRLERVVYKRGGGLIAPPESFFVIDREGPLVAGEADRARNWATVLVASRVMEPA